ncbi:FMRFamide receptor-like [Aplysia californica]|uniref:FMRFamide receptor-like n=1 Tax=Aplysia californica TaxID=6500 RepID=A0ABM0JE91_APLCA|nr:FMRFamide receptor-like [Aplysia californica]
MSPSFGLLDLPDSVGGDVMMNTTSTTQQTTLTSAAAAADDDLSDLTNLVMETIELVINCFLIHIIAGIGSACNIITVIVLVKTRGSDSNTTILLSLALCDLAFLLTLTVRKMDCIIARFDPVAGLNHQAYMTAYVIVTSRLVMFISSGHIIVIAVERFVAVIFPFKAKILFSRRRVMIMLLSLYVVMAATATPYLGYSGVVWSFNPAFNTTVSSVQFARYYLEMYEGLTNFNILVMGILRGPVSFTAVIACCAVIVHRLRQVSKQRETMSSSSSQQQVNVKVTRMLLALCAVYVITNLATVSLAVYTFVTSSNLLGPTLYFMVNMEEMLFALNSSANFFIYIFMSSKFYKTCRSLFCVSAQPET